MPLTTTYVVIPFAKVRGRLTARSGQTGIKSRDRAILAGERLLGTHPGALVLEQIADADNDMYSEPTIVARLGEVPDEAVDALTT